MLELRRPPRPRYLLAVRDLLGGEGAAVLANEQGTVGAAEDDPAPGDRVAPGVLALGLGSGDGLAGPVEHDHLRGSVAVGHEGDEVFRVRHDGPGVGARQPVGGVEEALLQVGAHVDGGLAVRCRGDRDARVAAEARPGAAREFADLLDLRAVVVHVVPVVDRPRAAVEDVGAVRALDVAETAVRGERGETGSARGGVDLAGDQVQHPGVAGGGVAEKEP